jgi:catechol 2,3-dioxygenase-like lactoylglutathione lyase family enzyme
MLAKHDLIAFVATAKPQKAKDFYSDVLGLHLVEDAPFALVFDAGKMMLRVSKVSECVPAPYTVLGWKVPDIRATMQELISKGITFERYAGMPQDALGIWTTPGDDKVSWFKDPDGNTLSLTQFRSK